MPDKVKKIIIPIVVTVLCLAVIGTVLAVVLTKKDDDGSFPPHIAIDDGNGGVTTSTKELQLSLKRERLETLTLSSEGLLVPDFNGETVDFSKSKKNVFGIEGDLLIGPKCYFSAHMAVSNSKPYAFEYWLEIIPENGGSLLADQLELTVTLEGEGEPFIKRTLGSGLTTKVFPTVEAGKTARFTAMLEYLDVNDNDKTKNTTLAFDMIVHARLAES